MDFMLNEEIVMNALIDEYNMDLQVIQLPHEDTVQIMNPEGYFIFPQTEKGKQIRDDFDQALLELIHNGTLSDISIEFLGRDYVDNITPFTEDEAQMEDITSLFDFKLVLHRFLSF